MEMKMDEFSLKYELYLKLGVQLISNILGMKMEMDKFSFKYELYLTCCPTDIWYFEYENG